MEGSKLLTIIVTVTVGIIFVGSLMAPVVNDIQKTAGTPATLNNATVNEGFTYEIWDGEAITLQYTGGQFGSESTPLDSKYTINDESSGLTVTQPTQRVVFASDAFCARIGGGSSTTITINSQYIGSTTQYTEASFKFEIETGGAYTLTINYQSEIDKIEYTGTITWLVYGKGNGDANLVQIATPSSPFYTSDANDVVVLGNIYTTGDNDTFYAYYDGKLTVNPTYADVSSVNIGKTLTDGYTDVYDTTVTVNVGDESFTPYFILAPADVSGHESAGAEYSLYGAIVLLAIAAILLLGVRAILWNDRD